MWKQDSHSNEFDSKFIQDRLHRSRAIAASGNPHTIAFSLRAGKEIVYSPLKFFKGCAEILVGLLICNFTCMHISELRYLLTIILQR